MLDPRALEGLAHADPTHRLARDNAISFSQLTTKLMHKNSQAPDYLHTCEVNHELVNFKLPP